MTHKDDTTDITGYFYYWDGSGWALIGEATDIKIDGLEGNPDALINNALYTHEAEQRALDTPEVRQARSHDERREILQREASISQIEREMERGL